MLTILAIIVIIAAGIWAVAALNKREPRSAPPSGHADPRPGGREKPPTT